MSSETPERKVAVLGAGKMAREHVRAFRDVAGAVVAGICSRTRARAEDLASEMGIESVCDSVAELYERTRADLIVVAVSEWAIEPIALECLDFPWLVLLEKPPGLSVPSAEGILERARRCERDVRVGLNRQWNSSTQAVLKGLAEADGRRFILVQDQQSLEVAAATGRPYDVAAHWMYANSIHLVDYFRLFGRGEVTDVEQIDRWDAAHPSMVLTKIRFDSGDEGVYLAIWHAPGPWAVSVTVPGNRWEMRPLEQATLQVTGGRVEPLAVSDWDREFKPGFRLQAQEIVAAALGRASQAPSLQDALQTMRLIQRIYAC